MDTDPVTGRPYPKDAIQRVLHISQKVHIYRIPPITSTRGFAAASWTQNPADQIFTGRLRIIETAIPVPASPANREGGEKISTTIVLEDPSSGQLFAAAPYDRATVVEQASDSSRFFAIRVVGGGGMKATLGLGYEERPDAFEFSVALQDVRRTLGLDAAGASAQQAGRGRPGVPGRGPAVPAAPAAPAYKPASDVKRDFSLKEGETITIDLGGKGRKSTTTDEGSGGGALFSLPPPPGPKSSGSASAMPFLPPPPSAADVKAQSQSSNQPSAQDLGFDDGEFGEFQ